jgi:GLPGLI family protein
MKHLLIIISIAFFVFPSIAQNNTDHATIRCYYLFSQKKKTGDITVKDTMTLDIGSQMSRYYDISRQQRDSIFQSILSGLDPNRIKDISIINNEEPNYVARSLGDNYRSNAYHGISEQIYKNRKNGNVTMFDVVGLGDRYKGNDPVGVLNWTILPDTASFLDYSCQKATLKFRGRNYEAWFSLQIPINDGPWKFFGLPGLILKVKDTEGQFDFECIGLENLNTPYVIEIPKGTYFDCNLKDYNKAISKKEGGYNININSGNIVIAGFKVDTSFQQIELE